VTGVDDGVEEPWLPDERATRVTVFLSLTDVHVNRSPVAGTLTRSEQVGDGFAPALFKGAQDNRRNRLSFDGPSGPVVVVQVAGAVARTISNWVRVGDRLVAGSGSASSTSGRGPTCWCPGHGRRPGVQGHPGDRGRHPAVPAAGAVASAPAPAARQPRHQRQPAHRLLALLLVPTSLGWVVAWSCWPPRWTAWTARWPGVPAATTPSGHSWTRCRLPLLLRGPGRGAALVSRTRPLARRRGGRRRRARRRLAAVPLPARAGAGAFVGLPTPAAGCLLLLLRPVDAVPRGPGGRARPERPDGQQPALPDGAGGCGQGAPRQPPAAAPTAATPRARLARARRRRSPRPSRGPRGDPPSRRPGARSLRRAPSLRRDRL
jgi:hypothetical protein